MSKPIAKVWRDGDKRTRWMIYDAGIHHLSNGCVEFAERVRVKETETMRSGLWMECSVDADSAVPAPRWWTRIYRWAFRRSTLPKAKARVRSAP